jgi:hypothetical protein
VDWRWLLATYGLTFLVCDSKLLERARRFVKMRSAFMRDLMGCFFCSGVWVAGALTMLRMGRAGQFDALNFMVDTFAGATGCYVINTTLLALEGLHDRHYPED